MYSITIPIQSLNRAYHTRVLLVPLHSRVHFPGRKSRTRSKFTPSFSKETTFQSSLDDITNVVDRCKYNFSGLLLQHGSLSIVGREFERSAGILGVCAISSHSIRFLCTSPMSKALPPGQREPGNFRSRAIDGQV